MSLDTGNTINSGYAGIQVGQIHHQAFEHTLPFYQPPPGPTGNHIPADLHPPLIYPHPDDTMEREQGDTSNSGHQTQESGREDYWTEDGNDTWS